MKKPRTPNPVRDRFSLFHILVLLMMFLLPVSQAGANPFLDGGEKPAPAPPRAVLSGGTGPFTDLQLDFRERMGNLLSRLKEKPSPAVITGFLLAAFFYGILHSAGPGHRKTIIFSLFLSRGTAAWYQPLAAGFLSSGIHAFAALGVIGVYFLIGRGIADPGGASNTGIYLEGFTFLFLVLLALFLIIRKTVGMAGGRDHHHDLSKSRNLYSLILVTSLVPCPGATMMMLMAVSLNLVPAGIFGVIAMSMGMGLVISGTGYLAVAGKAGLFHRIKGRENLLRTVSSILELGSYLFIALFSLFMAWPFLHSLVNPR